MAKYEPKIEQAIHEIAIECARKELDDRWHDGINMPKIYEAAEYAFNMYDSVFKEVSRYAESKEE